MTRCDATDVPGIARLQKLGHQESMVFPDLVASLPAQIHSVGFQVGKGPSQRWNGLHGSRGGLAAIQYTMSGRGRVRFVERQVSVEPGQAMLLYFPHDEQYWIEDGEQWEFFYLTLAGKEVIRCIRGIADRLGPILKLPADSPTLARAAEACADALEHKIESPYHGSRLAYAILMELLNESRSQTEVPTRPLRAAPPFVAEVEAYCHQNLAHPIGVAEMAQVAKLSKFHFSRKFRKVWGTSPARYLLRLRLELAANLIRSGGHALKDMAHQCGFSSPNYFGKVFRKSFGVTPRRFKADGL
jgi:AraC family transcriptional regulator